MTNNLIIGLEKRIRIITERPIPNNIGINGDQLKRRVNNKAPIKFN
jgi:hypothetical protein